jgi:shikimate dehydrogenase
MVARVASGPCPVVAWDAADVGEAAVCINATSIGLEGSDRGSWDRFGLAARRCALLDLRYGPVAGAFLMAAAGDVLAIDGATMLLHQGVAAFEQWTGVAAPVPVMRDALAAALNRDAAAIG